VAEFVFFYGTLMAGFDRRRRLGIDTLLRYAGRGSIEAALYDLGIYPAAVKTTGSRVWGEVFETDAIGDVLSALDEIEGHSPDDPDGSLYLREKVPADLPDGRTVEAWVYFYNAPLGHAPLIPSGDYLEHVRAR
jgi:gamma-glutamylaminecyclotransferase